MTRLRKKGKGFTLIELIAVLVIMAILALIVTPLVMSIIRRARISADKRSVDAYGRSIELAIASYLLDTGKFPTEVSQLTIEYSGDTVTCETTQINPDSSVYLAECKVKNRNVEGYTYGKDKQPKTYSIGDEVTYNGVDYYVIKDSGTKESIVTLLKAEPLTVDEVNQYGTGHINRYTEPEFGSLGTVYNKNGYGGMTYYTSETCGYVNDAWVDIGCTTNYAASEVKYAVDAWKNAQAPLATEARLITIDEIIALGYEYFDNGSLRTYKKTQSTPSWLYNEDYSYSTMSLNFDSTSGIWFVRSDGELDSFGVDDSFDRVVRPVIVLDKSLLNN